MSEVDLAGVKPFTPDSIAASHVAIALGVEEFVRSSLPLADQTAHQKAKETFVDLLDDQFREVFGMVDEREDQHDFYRF